MNDVLVRCIIKLKFKKFYIGKDYNGRWYKIIRNKVSYNYTVGGDYSFYANVRRGILIREAIPLEVGF